ncbi:uncharacterized protein LAESUDRAFT_815512 [Laetiporus sulphureus 93-53]|uniref:HAD-like protein n=1 Tax=Laetiporus sulphureus 93-53 TaxID=1314785 RepID=A0A165C1U2_9APHY|nr:uncharacterized protein LAESUDRAFT_815512 [Laetiporus sulphureus 93-53]KZT02048.1 hypothetical protein LAESUDRAFT_815512 [Laetiporus sulphureus 93-53]
MLWHSFIVAQFSPRVSAWWTSISGLRAVSAHPPTRPFLFLRVVHSAEPTDDFISKRVALYLVSPHKPEDSFVDCYFRLSGKVSAEKRLEVHPSLPSETPLYIHRFSFLQVGGIERIWDDAFVNHVYQDDDDTARHALTPASFDNFRTTSRKVLRSFLDRCWGSPKWAAPSDGKERVQDGWDSFSSYRPHEYINDPESHLFDWLEFEDLPLDEKPTIYDEVSLFDQFAQDYSWEGIDETVEWIEQMRKFRTNHTLLDIPSGTSKPSISAPTLNEYLEAGATALSSMKIPFDGDPLPPQDTKENEPFNIFTWDWDEDPEPEFAPPPKLHPPVAAQNVKVVIFDMFGTIVNHEATVNTVSRLLAPWDANKRLEGMLARLLLECFIIHAGLFLPADVRLVALKKLQKTELYPDVYASLKALHGHGYKILALPPADQHDLALIRRSLSPNVELPSLPTLPTGADGLPDLATLLDLCRQHIPAIQRSQILVVTNSLHRTVDPANAAGLPTAFLRRQGDIEAHVDRAKPDAPKFAQPTYTSEGLYALCTQLGVEVNE